MGNRRRTAILKKKFLEMFERSNAIITHAVRSVGITRATYYHWRQEDKEFDEACSEIEERQGDFVENALLRRIDDKDTAAIIFYCKTKLRNRGYSEDSGRQQVVINYTEK